MKVVVGRGGRKSNQAQSQLKRFLGINKCIMAVLVLLASPNLTEHNLIMLGALFIFNLQVFYILTFDLLVWLVRARERLLSELRKMKVSSLKSERTYSRWIWRKIFQRFHWTDFVLKFSRTGFFAQYFRAILKIEITELYIVEQFSV